MVFDKIEYLPDDIISDIYLLLPPLCKVFTNKKNYIKYNYIIDVIIQKGRYESYVRDIVRNDCCFIFCFLLQRNFKYLLTKTNYLHSNTIYPNYFFFLIEYSKKHNSYKCYNMLNLEFVLSGLKKKWCKSNRIKYNKWSN